MLKPERHARLTDLLTKMDVPSEKAKAKDIHDIHWLGRNVGLQNSEHPDIEEVRELLNEAGARMVM